MRRDLTLSLVTGILLALSYPPLRTGLLVYGALIPFFLLLQHKSGLKAFAWGYLTGLFYNCATLYWIGWVTVPGLFGTLLIMPLYAALYALVHTFLLRRLSFLFYAVVPFLWTSVEYLQSFGETAFPWNHLAYTQTYYLPLIQYAEFTSVYGISFWIVTINVVLYLFLKNFQINKKKWIFAVTLVVLFLGPAVYGLIKLQAAGAPQRTIKIALLQGNIDPFEKWAQESLDKNYAVYDRMTHAVLKNKPELVIWPETAIPFYLRHEYEYLDAIHMMADSSKIPIMTGAIDYEEAEDGSFLYYNSAFLFEPFSLRLQRYLKMKLVPFSECVPYRNFYPFRKLKDFLFNLQLGVGDYARGKEHTVFTIHSKRPDVKGKIRFSVPICFESVFPNTIRNFVVNGADFIAVITNDAWFGKTSAPFQHAQIAVMRAIENRIAIARCANTGISCFIDPYGHVLQHTDIFKEQTLTGEIPLRYETTFFTRYGNIFVNCVAGVTLVVIVSAFFVAFKPRSGMR
jgi:apolipoprotein N-acyltransferase